MPLSRRPRELFVVPPTGSSASPFDLAADGRKFLVRVPTDGSQPLEVILNWPALLKK